MRSETFAPAASAARAVLSSAFCMAGLASFQRWVRVNAIRGGAGTLPSTRRSRPVMAAAVKATSATPAPKTPAVSKCHATSFTPTNGIKRYDGLNPATLQNDAGGTTEPAVCVPNVIGTIPAATAAHEPDDEPPG